MTLEDMKTLLAGRLGQRTDIDDMIYREIRQAQRALEKTPPYPWFLLTAEESHLFIPPTYPLPANFIELLEDIIYIIGKEGSTDYFSLPFKVYGGHVEHTLVADRVVTGMPKNFTLFKDHVVFYPMPDVVYVAALHYYAKDATLDSPASENLWSTRAEDLLIAEAGWHVARNIRDNEAATLFGQDRAEARRRIAQETTSRLESMRRAVIGSGEDALLGQHSWEAGHQ